MCSTPAVAADQVDVEALLAAAPGLDTLAAALAIDPAVLDENDRLTLLEVTARLQAWLAAALEVPVLAAVTGPAAVDGDDFVREDVRATLRLSRPGAQDRIDVARALTTTLTGTRDALAAGRISYPQVTALAAATFPLDPTRAAMVEAAVLAKAGGMTVGEFRRAVAKAVLVADPKTMEEQHAVAAGQRRVVMYPSGAGMATILAELPAPDAQTIWLALDTLAHAGNTDRDLPVDARRADALTGLCTAALADPDLPRRHGRPVTVQVVVDLPTLLGLANHPGHLVGYGPIPTNIARALAADATWQRLVVEPVTGHLLDAGTTRYRPTQELKDYVLTRSRVCEFPTCHTPATTCDIDHTTPHHPDGGGGATSASNCGPKCRRHHQLKTHGGWTVHQHPDGTTTWTNPHGRTYHSPATDHRPGSP